MLKVFVVLLSLFIASASLPLEEKFSSKEKGSEVKQQDHLIGKFERSDLEQKPHSRWFIPTYKDYKPRKKALKTIKKNISDYEITVVMGTWCIDSQREIPKLYKILAQSDFDMDKITAIGVDWDLTAGGIAEELSANRVPTIIFYQDGKEINRFVEFPQKTFEEDIADIVSHKDYENPYTK